MNELTISPWLNAILGYMLGVESWFVRFGANLPFEGSRLVVGIKAADIKDPCER